MAARFFVFADLMALIGRAAGYFVFVEIDLLAAIGDIAPILGLIVGVFVYKQTHKQNHEFQRQSFVSGYVSKTFTHEGFSDTFYYLAYTYQTGTFERVKRELKDPLTRGDVLRKELDSTRKELRKAEREKKESIRTKKAKELYNKEILLAELRNEMFRRLEYLQGGREVGHRFYHPALFQGSVEEKRLDSLLGYFNTIAYYYYASPQLFTMKDIDGSIGFHLAIVVKCPAVVEYFKIIDKLWENNREYNTTIFGADPQYSKLRTLIEDLERHRENRS